MMMSRQNYILLVLGISLRLILVGQPPVEDNSWIRQTQTADAIASWVEESPLAFSARASWRGDLNARLLLELPLYNLMVWAPAKLGVSLDVAGRLVSMLLWVAGFSYCKGYGCVGWMRQQHSGQTFFLFSAHSQWLLGRRVCLRCWFSF